MKYANVKLIYKFMDEFFVAHREYENLKNAENIEKLMEKYCQVMKELSPGSIVLVPENEKEMMNKVYSIIAVMLEGGENVSGLLQTAHDWHSQENPTGAAKLQILFDLPYFKPDDWFNKYLKIKPLVLSLNSRLPKEIESRLYEATYCYIYGFYNGCAVLCRSILEGALREKLKGKVPKANLSSWRFEDILKFLEKTTCLDGESTWDIIKTKAKANKIIHNLQENVTKKRCYSILMDTRKLLKALNLRKKSKAQ